MKYIETNRVKAKIKDIEIISNDINLDANLINDGYIVTNSIITNEIKNNIKDVNISGIVNNLDVLGYSYIRLTNNTLVGITGFANGIDGKELCIINNTGNSVILYHENNNSIDINRIFTGLTTSIKDVIIKNNNICKLLYDGIINRWRLINTSKIGDDSSGSIKIFYHTFFTEEERELNLFSQGLYTAPQFINLEYYDGNKKRILDISNHIINVNNNIITVSTFGLDFSNNQYVILKAILFEESNTVTKHKLVITYNNVYLDGILLIPDVDYTIDNNIYIINRSELDHPGYINIFYYNGINKKPLDLSNCIYNIDDNFSISITGFNLNSNSYIEVNFINILV